jgi:hypothetical protein
MAFVLDDRVRETSTTTGTDAFTLGGAPGSYQTFSAVMSVGDTCWYAIVLPGSAWETGIGTYTSANVLTRTTVISSSNGGSAVNFGAGSKDVFITLPAKKQAPFPSGTVMLFQQTAAPIYWTKQTTHNDKALRVVSGAASSGGTNAFSAVLNTTVSVGNTTITQSTMASHAHTVPIENATGTGSTVIPPGSNPVGSLGNASTGSIGGDGSHNHTLALAIAYVDLILAAKD